jgi:ammonia channel protein AmtB
MVGPISDAERNEFRRRVKVGAVLLVAASAGLITLQTDAGLVTFGAAVAIGATTGAFLVWLVFPTGLDEFR